MRSYLRRRGRDLPLERPTDRGGQEGKGSDTQHPNAESKHNIHYTLNLYHKLFGRC